MLSENLARQQVLAGLFVLAFVNGTLPGALIKAGHDGWLAAVSDTFGISVLVWAAVWLGIRFLLQGSHSPIRSTDWLVALVVVALTLAPVAALAWLAMTGLALYVASTSEAEGPQHRGAWILLAVTVPMFWSRELFNLLSERLLELEAVLVGTAMGSPYTGNMVQLADGSGFLQIWPACSSFGNVSLAVLCWVMFSQATGYGASRHGAGWCLLACSLVVLINVARISLIGFYPQHYDLLHGPIGSSVAGWLALAASVAACWIGVRSGRGKTGLVHA